MVLRWLGILLLALAWMPSGAAGIFCFFGEVAGHEVRLSSEGSGELILHHGGSEEARAAKADSSAPGWIAPPSPEGEDHRIRLCGKDSCLADDPPNPSAADLEPHCSGDDCSARMMPIPHALLVAEASPLMIPGPVPWRGGVMRI